MTIAGEQRLSLVLPKSWLPPKTFQRFGTEMRVDAASIEETANKKNLLLLITLRWLAIGGQISAIAVACMWFGIKLPVLRMGGVIAFLTLLNLASFYRSRRQTVIRDIELFAGLLADVAALTMQLYLSGGATNPFVSLFLLQVILGAVLLQPLWTWILVVLTTGSFLWLTTSYRYTRFFVNGSDRIPGQPSIFDPYVDGSFICFLLAAVLLVLFVTRINRNLRDRDQRLSDLKQQAAEEEHIVRMGLLASGTAHELGSPLATLSVILNDWERMPALRADPSMDADIGEMHVALARCKDSVSRILLAAGEARGEELEHTTLATFIDGVVEEWRETRTPAHLDYVRNITPDTAIVSDAVIRQALMNVLDNALEASPCYVRIEALRRGSFLAVTVRDKGAGFPSDVLSKFGKPYQPSQTSSGSGLGFFLVVNVLRKLGGTVVPQNNHDGGASVELRLPVSALSIENEEIHAAG
jgi:two-component system, sensor histidine kinase RegB